MVDRSRREQALTLAGVYLALTWAPALFLAVYGREFWGRTSPHAHHWYVALLLAAGAWGVIKGFAEHRERRAVVLAEAAGDAVMVALWLPLVAWVALATFG